MMKAKSRSRAEVLTPCLHPKSSPKEKIKPRNTRNTRKDGALSRISRFHDPLAFPFWDLFECSAFCAVLSGPAAVGRGSRTSSRTLETGWQHGGNPWKAGLRHTSHARHPVESGC